MLERLTWAHIRRLALGHRKALLVANAVAILAVLCSVPIPLLLPLLVDEVLLGQCDQALGLINHLLPPSWQVPVAYIGLMLGFSLVLRLLGLLFNVWSVRQFAHLSKDIIYQIRLKLLAHLQRIAMSAYEHLGSGKVTAHLLTDLDTLDNFLGETLSRAVVAVLTLVGTSAILLWMHWQLALLILLLNPLVVLATIKLGKQVKRLKKQENDSSAHFTQALTESLEAIQEIRISHRQGYFFGRLGLYAQTLRDKASAAKWKTEASSRATGLLFQFGIDVFRAAAMLTVLFSDLSIGQMLAVFSYLWFMVAPVEQLLNLQYAYYAANGALVRINQLLEQEQEPSYSAAHNPFAGEAGVSICLDDIHFTYAQTPLFSGLSLSIAANEKVAIVGASGGGKSTLVQLLLGLYTPNAGRICYGGVDVTQSGFAVVREQVAVVLQHPALFDDSVRANLCMGREITDHACWQALEIAQLAPTIRALPDGLDTRVGRSGVRLSGGQRQRLAIARMILSDPKVVIMDEATSALDTATELALHQAMQDFLATRTTIIIAHRLSAVRQAERIIVLDQGRVCEEGEHASLIAQGGLYFMLYGHLQQA